MASRRSERIAALMDHIVVPPGQKINLKKDYDPGFTDDWVKKKEAQEILAEGIQQLAEYQDKLYAQDTYALLLIFQAMDAAGKDATIKHVMSGLNPQGTQVYSFKAPSAEDLDHDYLWRNFKVLPSVAALAFLIDRTRKCWSCVCIPRSWSGSASRRSSGQGHLEAPL
jgi:polyphosphate kinase 2 (PPK2 family)